MDLDSDGENEEPVYSSGNSREQFNIPGRKGKFQTGETIHTKYSNRPVKLEDVCLAQFFTFYVSCQRSRKKIKFDENCSTTLESGIDVGQGINVGPGKFVKKNKRRALNKHRACANLCYKKPIKLEKICRL